MKTMLVLLATAMTLAVVAPAGATAGKGQLFHNGDIVGTVVPPDHIASGSGLDPLYMVTNGASGQLGIAGVGPGDGPFHGGAWAVYLVTFNAGVTPYLLTSDEAVMEAADAGDVTVVRAPDLDNRCPVTQSHA
jgi:hypothetical protein